MSGHFKEERLLSVLESYHAYYVVRP